MDIHTEEQVVHQDQQQSAHKRQWNQHNRHDDARAFQNTDYLLFKLFSFASGDLFLFYILGKNAKYFFRFDGFPFDPG